MRCHSAARLAALQPPSLLETAAALRHVTGSPGPGLLRRLRPTRPVQRSARLSPAGGPDARPQGNVTGWFPCSLRFARRSRSPAVSQRPRHAYAAGFQRGLPDQHLKTSPGVLAASVNSETRRVRPRSARFEPVSKLKDVTTPVPLVLLSATLAGPAPSGSTGHVPALSGLLPPSPAPPGSGCPQLHQPAATGQRRRSLTSTRTTSASRRNRTG